MSISERIEGTLERWSQKWKDRLAGWMIGWTGGALNRFLETNEPEAIDLVRSTMTQLRDDPNTPADMRDLVDKLLAGTKPIPVVILVIVGVILFIPTITSISQPLGNLLRYAQERLFKTYRHDLITVIELLRRDPAKFSLVLEDLRDQGWNDTRIEHAAELLKVIPPLADMVRFADFGAFDPKIIELWREFYDAPDWIREPMSLLGITGEWSNKYWFSHWRQPGRFELGELHRRELVDDNIVKNAYLTQGFSGYWQDRLLDLVKEPWTRVDVRRMWDMRTINEVQLRKAYRAVGYYDEWLEGMVLWTKVYVAFPDLIARWTKGWITIDEVRAELTKLGMPQDRIEEMIQTKVEVVKPERVEKERDLTKTDIINGYKKGVISRSECIELLLDLGYDEDEAEYLIDVAVAVATGSPETFAEFKDLTTKWRRAVGKDKATIPEEFIQAAENVKRLAKDVEDIRGALAKFNLEVVDEDSLNEEARDELQKLRTSLYQAATELQEAKTYYNEQLAVFHHRG